MAECSPRFLLNVQPKIDATAYANPLRRSLPKLAWIGAVLKDSFQYPTLRAMGNADMTKRPLDRTDLKILDVLQQQGNLSSAELAEKVGLTATTAWRRISRLEQEGVIKQRVTLLDREAVGLNVTVFAHVRLSSQGGDAVTKFEQAVRKHPEILECFTMLGETDFLLRVVARDLKAYESFFRDHLSRFPGVQVVNSSIALSAIKETTALPLSKI
jgi:Lrp/AsnC family transcriptional regulator